jgi:hypothetical protein
MNNAKRNARKKAQRLRKKKQEHEEEDEFKAVEHAIDLLSEETRAALEEHLREKKQMSANVKKGDIGEDFGLSQFWYDEASSKKLAEEAIEMSKIAKGDRPGKCRIACVSCPSIYKAIKVLLGSSSTDEFEVVLFEYDKRMEATLVTPFETIGSAKDHFVFYDFQVEDPKHLIPERFWGYFDFVAADPPYLNAETLKAFEKAVLLISHSHTRRLFCTGAVMEQVFTNEIPAYRPCEFRPEHSSKLGNAFMTFSTYESVGLGRGY